MFEGWISTRRSMLEACLCSGFWLAAFPICLKAGLFLVAYDYLLIAVCQPLTDGMPSDARTIGPTAQALKLESLEHDCVVAKRTQTKKQLRFNLRNIPEKVGRDSAKPNLPLQSMFHEPSHVGYLVVSRRIRSFLSQHEACSMH